jgi:hypothetical protein
MSSTRDDAWSEAVLQHLALTTVIGVVGRSEHAARLHEHTRPVAVVPQLRLHQHRHSVVVAADDVEGRLVDLLAVQRAVLEQVVVAGRRFEVVGVGEVRVCVDRWRIRPPVERRGSRA